MDVPRVGTLKFIKENQAKHPPKLLRTENDMTKEADSKGGPGGQEKESKGGPGGVEMCLRWMCFAPRRVLFSWCFKSPPHTVFLCFCVLCFGTCSRPAFSGPPRPLPRKMGPRGPKNRHFFGPPFGGRKIVKNRAQAYTFCFDFRAPQTSPCRISAPAVFPSPREGQQSLSRISAPAVFLTTSRATRSGT